MLIIRQIFMSYKLFFKLGSNVFYKQTVNVEISGMFFSGLGWVNRLIYL